MKLFITTLLFSVVFAGCLGTPLTSLVKNSHYNEIEKRVQNKESLESSSPKYWSPLLVAANNGDIKMMKFLVTHGADLNAKHISGTYPLYQFVLYGYMKNDPKEALEMVKWMVQKGTNYKILGHNGYSLLHISQDVALSEYLVSLGLSVKALTKNCATTLMGTLSTPLKGGWEDIRVQKYLVQHCVDLNKTATFGKKNYTALDFAKKFQRKRAYAYIEDAINNPPKECLFGGVIAPKISFHNLKESYESENVTISVALQDQGYGIGDVELFINGADTLSLEDDNKLQDVNGTKVKIFHVKLQNGLNEITAYAYDANNTRKSKKIHQRVVASYKVDKPKLYLVTIGINEFEDSSLNLKYARSDAEYFRSVLQERGKNIFSQVKFISLLEKEETTKEAIEQKLLSLRAISANDTFVLYIASHGVPIGDDFYIATSNVSEASESNIKKNAFSQKNLKGLLRRIPTANKLILIDACYSGAITGSLQQLAKKSLTQLNLTTISASSSQQVALEGLASGHGIFTQVLVRAIEGDADINKDGAVQTMELVNYVQKMVPIEAKKYNHIQIPKSFQSGQVFNVSRSRGFAGRIDMKPQYYNPEEIEKIKLFMKNNDLKSLNAAIEKNKKSVEAQVSTHLETNSTKKSLDKAEAKILNKRFTFAAKDMIFDENHIFLHIGDKLKMTGAFKDEKGRDLIYFDFYSAKPFDKIKKELDTSKVSNIYMANRGDWYRITLETKAVLTYKYEATKEWFLIELEKKKKVKK